MPKFVNFTSIVNNQAELADVEEIFHISHYTYTYVVKTPKKKIVRRFLIKDLVDYMEIGYISKQGSKVQYKNGSFSYFAESPLQVIELIKGAQNE